MIALEKRHYASVSANSSSSLDYTVTNNKTLYLYFLGGSAAVSTDVKVEIIWDATGDNTIIFATHGTVTDQQTALTFDGNGSKKITIKLTNDTDNTETIGAYWIGEEF